MQVLACVCLLLCPISPAPRTLECSAEIMLSLTLDTRALTWTLIPIGNERRLGEEVGQEWGDGRAAVMRWLEEGFSPLHPQQTLAGGAMSGCCASSSGTSMSQP